VFKDSYTDSYITISAWQYIISAAS
ncbi:MAG: hypothetical protein UY82_C0040G0001, partial [Candidatus Uhrbacteria bacterium GW2011_GWC2_53_7]